MSWVIWTQRQCSQTKIFGKFPWRLVGHWFLFPLWKCKKFFLPLFGNARNFLLQLDVDQNNFLLYVSLNVCFPQPASLGQIKQDFLGTQKRHFKIQATALVRCRDQAIPSESCKVEIGTQFMNVSFSTMSLKKRRDNSRIRTRTGKR